MDTADSVSADARRRHALVPSPLGPLRVVVDVTGALVGVYLPGHRPAPGAATLGVLVGQSAMAHDDALVAARDAVLAVATDPRAPFDVPLGAVPGTAFQHDVWDVVAGIDVGRTLTYAQVAEAVGRPSAHRSVGSAVGANPRCVVVPCHRVVGSRGRVTGYAGSTDLKRWLLAREQNDRLEDLTPSPAPT